MKKIMSALHEWINIINYFFLIFQTFSIIIIFKKVFLFYAFLNTMKFLSGSGLKYSSIFIKNWYTHGIGVSR